MLPLPLVPVTWITDRPDTSNCSVLSIHNDSVNTAVRCNAKLAGLRCKEKCMGKPNNDTRIAQQAP